MQATIITPDSTPRSLHLAAIRNSGRIQRELEVVQLLRDIVALSITNTADSITLANAYLDLLKKYEPQRWPELLAYESINIGNIATLKYAVEPSIGAPWLEQALAACIQRSTGFPAGIELVAASIRRPSRRLQNYLRTAERPELLQLIPK